MRNITAESNRVLNMFTQKLFIEDSNYVSWYSDIINYVSTKNNKKDRVPAVTKTWLLQGPQLVRHQFINEDIFWMISSLTLGLSVNEAKHVFTMVHHYIFPQPSSLMSSLKITYLIFFGTNEALETAKKQKFLNDFEQLQHKFSIT